ncbi:hypothetical protein KUTeg_015787 [Tegillarca granosa]|uniref:C2H2-type domain-containing protein n=1 Tax=Tegillarca granosa TaxID=220873 RepID=A0ABQ9ES28_TEGGR|nr:hypothetical protein KUTeg_015787 [Tegillarca granosa]
MRFPITPRITRSVARKQEKSCSTNKTKSSDNIKTTKISEMVDKVRDNRKGTKMKWRKKEKPNKKEMTDNEKEYDREKKEGVNKLEIKDKKKEYDRQKKDGVYKLKRKKEKECEREMVEENDTDKETNKENKMDDSAVFLHDGKTNKEYVCKICHEMFEKYSNFQDHVRDLKHFQDQNLRCNVCDTFFTNMRSIFF